MWNSGQQPPAWGWPPNMNYQYNQQAVDPSQSWAAAAALWAQQRHLAQQYQNGNVSSPPVGKPPEPPGPPPVMPPLPPVDMPANNQQVEVHDYMHGKPAAPPTEVVDYQHGIGTTEVSSVPPATDVIDYNHGKQENFTDKNWTYDNDTWQQSQQPYFSNEQWNNEYANYYNPAEHETHQRSNDNISSKDKKMDYKLAPSGFQSTYSKTDSKQNNIFKNSSGNSSPDPVELAKKTKSLPLWLRQGLEKLEKTKKKSSSIDDNADDKSENSPVVSAKEEEESDEERGEDHSERQASDDNDTNRRSRLRRHSPSVERSKVSELPSENESEDEEDEEEKQKRLMLKIKTWMTEILLGVTNTSLKEVCHEVYFEIKKSVKVKAQQLRRSGGLDALRMASLGDEESSSSEEEVVQRPVKQKEKDISYEKQETKKTLRHASEKSTDERAVVNQDKVVSKSTVTMQKDPVKSSERHLPDNSSRNESKASVLKRANVLKRVEKCESYEVDDIRSHGRKEQKTSRAKPRKQDRKSSPDDDENRDVSVSESSESSSESPDSEKESRRKKSKKRRSRSESRSPRRKSRKKTRRYERESSSSESDRRTKKKKKRSRSSSSEDDYDSDYSSQPKKKSMGKKHKHKARSSSRSPRRYKRKR